MSESRRQKSSDANPGSSRDAVCRSSRDERPARAGVARDLCTQIAAHPESGTSLFVSGHRFVNAAPIIEDFARHIRCSPGQRLDV